MVAAIQSALTAPQAERAAEPTNVVKRDAPMPAESAAFQRVLSARSDGAASNVVTTVRTKLDGEQAASALRAAWTRVTGEPPSEGAVAVLTAQWAHETGTGASMYNYNFGGIKGAGPEGFSVAQQTREGYGKSEHTIVDRFRAYRSADQGATDYVQFLVSRFPEAANSAKAGDPVGFVQGLRQRGYFTGDPAAYTRAVASFTAQGLEQGFSAIGTARAGSAALPELAMRAARPPSGDYSRLAAFGPEPLPPLIDALKITDEISRAALRIMASPTDRSEG
ncbi:MAG TPA: glucosaminidase domain-containing protein [Polyangiaceae bacterium]|jgi:hypothetical protein